MKQFINNFCSLTLPLLLAGAAFAAETVKDSAPAAQSAVSLPAPAVKPADASAAQTQAKASARANKADTKASLEKATASPAKEKDYVACFAAWDKNMHTLRTDFIQTTEYDGILISRSEGRIYYAQNGQKLRLDNLEGGKVTQSALTNKKNIWVLDEKGQEVTQVSWQQWLSGQPNQALFDFGHYTALIARHDVSVLEHKDGLVILRLQPKDKKQNYTLYVAVGEEDCFPAYITIQSDLMKTTAELTDKRLNADLKKELFKRIIQ